MYIKHTNKRETNYFQDVTNYLFYSLYNACYNIEKAIATNDQIKKHERIIK